MTSLSYFKTRQPVIYLLAICFFIPVIAMFFPSLPVIKEAQNILPTWNTVIIGFTYLPSTISLLIRNAGTIKNKKTDWPFELWTIVVMALTFIVYFASGSITSDTYRWLYNTIYSSCQSAVWGIIAFYMIIVPTYAFKFRNPEAAIFAAACMLVAMYNAPAGAAIWEGFPIIGAWLLDWPFKGVNTIMEIIGALGTFLICLRLVQGKEKGILV